MQLSDIRKEIDLIDEQLSSLLIKRMDCSLKVAQIKKEQGLPVYHPGREKEIIDNISQKSEVYGKTLAEIYRFIMASSRELQHERLTGENSGELFGNISNNGVIDKANISGDVACYGSYGAFTHLALNNQFKENTVNPIFMESFEDVFEAVMNDKAKFGIVPVENSSAGSVSAVYDLLIKYPLYIACAIEMPVTHNLLGVKGTKLSDIKKVYSHNQALSQCKIFLKENNLEPVAYKSTAASSELAANLNDKSIAAIGSYLSAQKNGLDVIKNNIETFKNNKTRFIIISKDLIIENNPDKISLVFSLPHTPGSLERILTRFSVKGLNLTKLESRAGARGDFETKFYLDFTGDVRDASTCNLLSALKAELNDFAFLGNYKEFSGGTKK